MPSIQNDDCFILNLPNELLSDTLSRVPPNKRILFVRRTKKVVDSPFHSVHSVCRQFRAIVAELRFWYLPDFDILKSKLRFVKGIHFLHELFPDRHIFGTLQRRTDWPGLVNMAALELVTNGVPVFRGNPKSVYLQ